MTVPILAFKQPRPCTCTLYVLSIFFCFQESSPPTFSATRCYQFIFELCLNRREQITFRWPYRWKKSQSPFFSQLQIDGVKIGHKKRVKLPCNHPVYECWVCDICPPPPQYTTPRLAAAVLLVLCRIWVMGETMRRHKRAKLLTPCLSAP